MSRLLRGVKVLRNHWKKSVLGFSLLAYGSSYGVEKYKTFQLMRAYCEEAKLFGEETMPCLNKARHITVILNPAAHDGKARSLFEKFSAPLLHLAGMRVSVIETEGQGHAKDIMEIMDNTDAVLIAGGNGTLHEAVTGLLRRSDILESDCLKLPLGIVPVGKTNTVAKYLFWNKDLNNAQWLAEATMAVIKEKTASIDVIKIKGEKGKPVFAVSDFELGMFSDLERNLSKYWYFGPLKGKVAYLINSVKNWSLVDDMNVEYVSPCSGCSKCYAVPVLKKDNVGPKRWWSAFIPKAEGPKSRLETKDCSSIINSDCGIWHADGNPFSNMIISTYTGITTSKAQNDAFLINRYPPGMTVRQFIHTGWKHHEGDISSYLENSSTAHAREVKLTPKEPLKEKWFYIDSENYEAQPVHISLLPRSLLVYVKEDLSV